MHRPAATMLCSVHVWWKLILKVTMYYISCWVNLIIMYWYQNKVLAVSKES